MNLAPICPKCGKTMRDDGDDGLVYTTDPPQRRLIFTCDEHGTHASRFTSLGRRPVTPAGEGLVQVRGPR